MVGVGLMNFPTCPQEAVLLQKFLWEEFNSPNSLFKESSRANLYGLIIVDWFRIHGVAKLKPLCLDIIEAKEYLKQKGVDLTLS
ncbi:unnamed protein product [Sphenostylis stenocarpa]|uniref:Uncharacterized protein n=1 Tax=Sphenostylis stenocarpa TaxID=92480 RepID=A0AA86RSW1_9FABA|nr:unnamed protein product [Sphenostylis stenocarpa]